MTYYDERLHEMLRYKRPHRGKTVTEWVNKFIKPYKPYTLGPKKDPAAYVVEVGISRTMFSAHVDTVHREDGKQRVLFDKKHNNYYKNDGKPLGADDTAGCWVMLEMIDAEVPGVYVFHTGEECGGIGSTYIAAHHKDFLSRFDRAIAFDRRGSTSVITHQGWGRCASNDFAEALSDELNKNPECMYLPDDTGIFTDTANYIDDIPECTNISCGYASEHSSDETLHVPTVMHLRDACLLVDWENLPVIRKPGELDYKDDFKYFYPVKDTNANVYDGKMLYNMTKAEMMDMAYTDPETFVELVREELFGEDIDEDEYDIKGWAYGY
jgi:hypothetical protein